MASRIFLMLFVVCMILPATMQSENIIHGTVKNDEGKNLDAVWIILLSAGDSVAVSATYSDEKGQYCFEGVSDGRFIVKAAPFITKPVYKNVMMFGNSKMEVNFIVEETVQLEEVVVKSTGITVSGDTTSYAVNHFSTGNERNLKDVLETLPGIRVDASTNAISAKGKPVRRVLLENQDLFQGNTAVPLNNISPEVISRVEIIDNFSEYDIYSGFRSTDETVINIKARNGMRNTPHGNVEINAGIINKYNVKGYAVSIGRKTMLSALLSTNNIGKKPMSFQDVIAANGGYNTLLSGANPVEQVQSAMEDFSAFMDSRKDFQKRDNGLLSLNVVMQPGKALKVSASYTGNMDRRHSNSSRQYTYLSGLKYNELQEENVDNKNSLAKLSLHFTPSKEFNVLYTGSMVYADRHNLNSGSVSSSRLDYKDEHRLKNIRNNVKVIKRIGNNLLTLSVDYNACSQETNLNFNSDSLFYAERFGLDKEYVFITDIRRTEIGAELFYLYRMSDDYYFRTGVMITGERQTLHSDLQQVTDNGIYNARSHVSYCTNDVALKFGKDKGRFIFNAAVKGIYGKASANLENPLSEGEVWKLLPSLHAKYSFSQTHNLTFDYSLNLRKNNLQDVADGYLISAYNTINTGKQAGRLFYNANRISLIHVFRYTKTGERPMCLPPVYKG